MEDIFAVFDQILSNTNCEYSNMEDKFDVDLEVFFDLMEAGNSEREEMSDTTWASQDINLKMLMEEILGEVSLFDKTGEEVESPTAPVMALTEVLLGDDSDENPAVSPPPTPPTPPTTPPSPTPPPPPTIYSCSTLPPFQPAKLCTHHVQSWSYSVPAVQSCEVFPHSLHPVGYLNGEAVYELSHEYAPISAPVPLQHQQEGKHYVKKPPNAFMLYRQEQRHNIVSEYNITDSAAINKILGAKWNSLSKEQQARYYKQAEMEKLFHAQQHPEWSVKDNYGKKRKRKDNNKAKTEPAAESQRAKKSCMSFADTTSMTQFHAMQPHAMQPHAMQPYVSQPYMTQPHQTQPYITQPYMTQHHRAQHHMIQDIPQTDTMQDIQTARMEDILQTDLMEDILQPYMTHPHTVILLYLSHQSIIILNY
ncbi:hypothetical protein PAMP_001058 [Pampus punctatissimus]